MGKWGHGAPHPRLSPWLHLHLQHPPQPGTSGAPSFSSPSSFLPLFPLLFLFFLLLTLLPAAPVDIQLHPITSSKVDVSEDPPQSLGTSSSSSSSSSSSKSPAH